VCSGWLAAELCQRSLARTECSEARVALCLLAAKKIANQASTTMAIYDGKHDLFLLHLLAASLMLVGMVLCFLRRKGPAQAFEK